MDRGRNKGRPPTTGRLFSSNGVADTLIFQCCVTVLNSAAPGVVLPLAPKYLVEPDSTTSFSGHYLLLSQNPAALWFSFSFAVSAPSHADIYVYRVASVSVYAFGFVRCLLSISSIIYSLILHHATAEGCLQVLCGPDMDTSSKIRVNQARTILGPLTTTFTPPVTCEYINAETTSWWNGRSSWRGQSCKRGSMNGVVSEVYLEGDLPCRRCHCYEAVTIIVSTLLT